MKKYKHKITGDVIEEGFGGKVYKGHFYTIPKEFVENSNDWEEIIEEEFKILEFKGLQNNTFSYVGKSSISDRDSYVRVDCPGYCIDNLPKEITIVKIRRLSDDEVFTIGDLCYPKNKPLNYGRITELEYCKAGYFRIGCKGKYYIGINDVVKTKELLFYTEDNVPIFEGDSYWCVNTCPHLWSLFKQTAKERTQLNKTVLAFSTENLAQEYIDNNKPIYSKNQIKLILANSQVKNANIKTLLCNLINNGQTNIKANI